MNCNRCDTNFTLHCACNDSEHQSRMEKKNFLLIFTNKLNNVNLMMII